MLQVAKPLLLNFDPTTTLEIGGWEDCVQSLHATYTGVLQLPLLGAVARPDAVLIRPDGYVAWVGEGTDRGLSEALTRWFGPSH